METIERKSCRAILLTPEPEILLIKISNPSGSWIGWITPGGGMDEGESEEKCLRRELWEELGITDFTIEAKIWTRSHEFPWSGNWIKQSEVFFLIRTPKFKPASNTNLTETEMMEFLEMRWWAVEALKSSQEEFVPRQIAEYVAQIMSNGAPAQPIAVGI